MVANVLSVVVEPRPVLAAFEGAAESTLLPFLRSSAPPRVNVVVLLVTPLTLACCVEVGTGVVASGGVSLCPGWVSFEVGTLLATSVVVEVLLPLLSLKEGTGGRSESR